MTANFRARMLAAAACGLCGALPIFGTCIVSGDVSRAAAVSVAASPSEDFESPSVLTRVSRAPVTDFNSRPPGLAISFR